MSEGVVADFESIRVHRNHLAIRQIPVLAGFEGIEITDVDRAAQSQLFEHWGHDRVMTRRRVVEGEHDQFVGNRLEQHAIRIGVHRRLCANKSW